MTWPRGRSEGSAAVREELARSEQRRKAAEAARKGSWEVWLRHQRCRAPRAPEWAEPEERAHGPRQP